MKSVHKSVLIWYSAAEMYALVTDVARYPEFLPWCSHARVLAETESGMTAEVGIAFKGVTQSFTTRNEHTLDREVRLHLVDGPFSRLEGDWVFTPVGDDAQRACRVGLKPPYLLVCAIKMTNTLERAIHEFPEARTVASSAADSAPCTPVAR